MNRFQAFLASEKEKIGALPDRKAKAEYIWQYYKLWIIGIVCVIWLVGFTIYRLNTAVRENWFYVTFSATNADVGNDSDFWEGFVEYSGYDITEKNVMFNNASYFDYTQNQARGNAYYNLCVAYIEAGTLDAITMTKEALVQFGSSGRLLDLNAEECASIVEKYGDRLIYTQPIDEEYSEDLVPVGIDVSDSRLMTEYHLYSEDCALGIGAYSQHLDAVETFLDYIFEEAE
jgi:hypothetical protein